MAVEFFNEFYVTNLLIDVYVNISISEKNWAPAPLAVWQSTHSQLLALPQVNTLKIDMFTKLTAKRSEKLGSLAGILETPVGALGRGLDA